jgi:arylsulfatase A-like enzyme
MVDEHFGKILDYLEQSGQLENTIVIFSTDHGESLGDHGLTQKGCRFYDGQVRVPLIWSWVGDEGRTAKDEGGSSVGGGAASFVSGRVSDALVELTDVMPTLMDLAGLPVPERTNGRSLLPILTGRVGAEAVGHHRDFVRCEYYDAIDGPNHTWGTMYRDRRHKLIVYHDLEQGELFDMEADPHEHRTLWDDPAAQAMKARLLQRSFDATVRAIDYGPARIAPY